MVANARGLATRGPDKGPSPAARPSAAHRRATASARYSTSLGASPDEPPNHITNHRPAARRHRSRRRLESGPRTFGEMVLNATERYTGIALEFDNRGHRVQIAYPDLGTIVTEIARGLIALGIEQGDRVAILGSTSAEWTMADYGALCAGAVVTPIYHTNSPEECAYVLAALGRPARVLRRPRPGREGRRGPRSVSGAQAGRAVRRRRRRCAVVAAAAQARPGRDREGGSPPAPGDRPGRRRNARLHVGHDRAAEGLHAHPCELPRRDADVRRSARDQRHAHDVPVPAARTRARAGRPGGGHPSRCPVLLLERRREARSSTS